MKLLRELANRNDLLVSAAISDGLCIGQAGVIGKLQVLLNYDLVPT